MFPRDADTVVRNSDVNAFVVPAVVTVISGMPGGVLERIVNEIDEYIEEIGLHRL